MAFTYNTYDVLNGTFVDWNQTIPIKNFTNLHKNFDVRQCRSYSCIYFVDVSPADNFTSVTQCAVFSAAVRNPNNTVVMVYRNESKKIPRQWASLRNIVIFRLNETELFNGTVLRDWYEGIMADPKKSGFLLYETANAVRLALLYKFGGIYLDTDLITLKVPYMAQSVACSVS
ncbi:MAG: hypothetical protein GY800_10630 [Planctomycetes bacterium]|nr:hypothetical protein [Planctomycetota bacterium]